MNFSKLLNCFIVKLLRDYSVRRNFRRYAGFSLIEVLVAVTIIGLLAGVAVTGYSSVTKSSRDARRKADLEQVRSALEVYRSETGYYPDPGSSSYVDFTDAELVDELVDGGYIQALPKDPLPATHPSYKAYMYKATDLSGTVYYGYCLQTHLEASSPTNDTDCTLDSGYNYALTNP